MSIRGSLSVIIENYLKTSYHMKPQSRMFNMFVILKSFPCGNFLDIWYNGYQIGIVFPALLNYGAFLTRFSMIHIIPRLGYFYKGASHFENSSIARIVSAKYCNKRNLINFAAKKLIYRDPNLIRFRTRKDNVLIQINIHWESNSFNLFVQACIQWCFCVFF